MAQEPLVVPVTVALPAVAPGAYLLEGRFDLRTGVPTAGPPRRPLTRIVLEMRGRDIYAVAAEERTA